MEQGGCVFFWETTDQPEERGGEEQRLQIKSDWAGQGDTRKLLAHGYLKRLRNNCKERRGQEDELRRKPRGCFLGTEGEEAELAVTQKKFKLTATNGEVRTHL